MNLSALQKFFSLTLLSLLASTAIAQVSATQAPTIWLAPDLNAQPIRLSSLDIQIRMQGFVARTTLDLTFDNPNDRVLEGEFVFPLAAGQALVGYALEVNGTMREGVVVDKQTARLAFEETTRQQIDPGLAELTAGNVFRTRLYPIPARGSKRVRLHLESLLADQGSAWRYRLPMSFSEPVTHLRVRAEATLASSAPLVDTIAGDPELTFEQTEAAWVAEFALSNVRPQKELAFRIPKSGSNDIAQIEAVDLTDPSWRSVIAQVDTGLPTRSVTTAKPRRIALFVDASASARDRDRAREQSALAAYLHTLTETEVLLIAFRNDADPVQRFRVRNGDAGALIQTITELPLDGGSSYGAVDLHGLGAIDQVLVIGDGLSNFGASEARLLADGGATPPVFAMHAAQRADHARLSRLVRDGGGQLIDLTAQTTEQAVAALQQRAWRLLKREVVSGECHDIAPTASLRVETTLTLSARCQGKAVLRLHFGYDAVKPVQRTIAIGTAPTATGALAESVHRLWAQTWIDQLNAAAKPDETEIVALAKRYGVVTRSTSLLVLDRIEDYVRYRVQPKETELRAEYQRLLAQQPKTIADPSLSARLDALAQRWKEFRDYHAAPYPGIESLLISMADQALQTWVGSESQQVVSGRADALKLKAQAIALTERWPREGGEPESRDRWEREAAQLVFAIEAMRARQPEERIKNENEEMASILVTGSRIEGDDDDAVATQTAPAAAPPPEPMADAIAEPSAAPEAGGALAAHRSPVRHRESAALSVEDKDSSAIGAHETALPAQIELSGWKPDTPYLRAIQAAADPYRAYLAEREQNASAPAFFLDVADYLRDKVKSPRLALRVLSNLAELDTENVALTRVLAYRLAQWDLYALAVPQFELALTQRGEEPQSYRDLALALARAPKPDMERAVALLWQVATRDWHGRFPDIELIALHELNDVLATSEDDARIDLTKIGIDERFIDPVAVGLRVVLSWDADNTDIDLWVTDPSGDKAYYSTPHTRTGGHVSRDFTQGYGPEVFTIRRPLPGTYVVHVNYFGDRRQSLTGPVTIQLEFQTRFGSIEGQRMAVTRRLEGSSETIEIGRFKVGR